MILMIAFLVLLAGLSLPSGSGFEAFLAKVTALPPSTRNGAVRAYLDGRRLPVIEADSVLVFLWFGQAESVYVNGSLQNGWRHPEKLERLPCAGDTSLFHKRYIVPSDAALEYQLVVDGKYGLDPGNARTTPDGDFPNSQAVMPRFRPTPWAAVNPHVPRGSVDTLMFSPADTGLAPRQVFVYRPHGAPPEGGYALAVVHDGGTALRFLSLTTIADNMIAAAEVPPFIAAFVPAVERGPEYLGLKLPRYLNALADELVPMIQRRYGTARDPFRCASLGISNGGHVALLSPLLRGDVFGLCAGQSSTIDQDLLVALDLRGRHAPLPPETRIYQQVGSFDIVSGEYHFPERNRMFSALLARTGVHYRFVESSDGHEWPAWRERVPEILRFLFKPL
jgi:enterochelin esterase family protein